MDFRETKAREDGTNETAVNQNATSNNCHDPFAVIDLVSEETLKRIRSITSEDPFAPENYAIEQDVEDTNAESLITTIVVGKPGKQSYFRTCSSFRVPAIALFKREQSDVYYMVTKSMLSHPALDSHIKKVELWFCVSMQGGYYFWPIGLPNKKGDRNEWHEAALKAAKLAQSQWIQVSTHEDRAMLYKITAAKDQSEDPQWPDKPINELLKIAFGARVIDSPDHDVIKYLEGSKSL